MIRMVKWFMRHKYKIMFWAGLGLTCCLFFELIKLPCWLGVIINIVSIIQYTGVSNRIIKENFLFLKNSGKPFLIRTPLIEGKTDSKENLRKIKEFIGDVKWERLPENKLGLAKKEMLNV